MKPALLFLCHRIPFPPNKGDKIRSYHLLKYLSEHYRVYLGTFIDDADDWQYVEKVEALCEACLFINLNPLQAKMKSISGLVTGDALTLPYYRSRELQNWVKAKVDGEKIDIAVAMSSPMAQFLEGMSAQLNTQIIDLVDIDSDKWLQYANAMKWPMSWVYRREADKLLAYEKKIAKQFDMSFFVSSTEADMFKRKVPELAEKVSFYNNGVDSDYFSSSAMPDCDPVYPDEHLPIVFTGAMDYWPNVDAVYWFAHDILPSLRQQYPDLHFYIVGSKPTEKVQNLEQLEGITVTGRVEDIRPYIHYAFAAVAPMKIARGIQNKVLEAMAMEKSVVVTSMGLEGIKAVPDKEVLIADTAQEFIHQISSLIEHDKADIGTAARQRVMVDFSWDSSLPVIKSTIERLLENR